LAGLLTPSSFKTRSMKIGLDIGRLLQLDISGIAGKAEGLQPMARLSAFPRL